MTTLDSLQKFFRQMENTGGIIVNDQPRLDLDLYIQNYSGRTRFDRLLHIGKTCVPLCLDALKAAVAEAKAGSDTSRYIEAVDCLRTAAPEEPEAQHDEAWIAKTERANRAETTRLETELKGYKNNLIKESIRMGNEDLGRHFESIGNLNEAIEAYSKMRSDVGSTKHIIDSGMHLVNLSLQRRDWAMAISNMGKISGVQSDEEGKFPATYVKVVSGIALLGQGKYADAAKSFLKADFSTPSTEYNHIASPNDVAVYGGLTALATRERRDLQNKVLDNQSFRTFLEHEPHIRKAISFFVNGRYSSCLSILESYRNDYLLDIYLHRHVSELYSQIRNKCIVQYFIPFSCVTLANLEAAFARPRESLQDEIADMIREGTLGARIDAKNRLLVAVQPDPRLNMQKEALELARNYEQEAKERLRRMSIVAANLEVSGHNKQGPHDTWYSGEKDLSLSSGVESQGL